MPQRIHTRGRGKKPRAPRGADRLYHLGALVICVLAVTYSLFTILNVERMQRLTDTIFLHPFKGSSAAWQVRSCVAEMRIYLEQLVAHNTPQDVENVRASLGALYEKMADPLAYMRESYQGPAGDMERILDKLERLRGLNEEFLLFAATHNTDRIAREMADKVAPAYVALNRDIDVSLEFATENMDGYMRRQRRQSVTASVYALVLCAGMICVALFFSRAVSRKNRDIYYREMLFGLLSANIDDVFFIRETERGSLEYVSPNAGRILGLEDAEIQRAPFALFDCFEDAGLGREVKGLLLSGGIEAPYDQELRFKNPKSGEVGWVRMRIYPVHTKGRITRYISCLSDLTEQKRSQQALGDALHSAQEANEAKRVFLSRMSHEIRTPMNAITGMASIAAASLDNPARVRDCLQKIDIASKHLLTLINDILDMSRIESGKLSIASAPFDLRQLIDTVTALMRPQAKAAGVSFEAVVRGVTREALVGDAMRLRQILLNLLSNAIKFTPAGGRVFLEVRQLSQRENCVYERFTVRDSGVGMSAQFLQRIFSPFEQAEGAAERGGAGLGMPITKNLVTMMGGSIDVSSEPGRGSTFQVELPFGLPLGEEGPPPAGPRDLRVLTVEHREEGRRHLAEIFEGVPVRSDWAASGEEGVAMARRAMERGAPYGICFVDWGLPPPGGQETVRRLREAIGARALLLVLCDCEWAEIEGPARAAGAESCLTRPIFPSAVRNVLLSVSQQADAQETPPEQSDFGGRRILVVEDNELNLEIAVAFIEGTGAQVDTARNGLEAVERFEGSAPGTYDAILLDIQMPVMDGYEAARRIRAGGHPDAKKVCIVAMTANAFSADVAAALGSGMDEHVSKPIDIRVLTGVLKKHFNK